MGYYLGREKGRTYLCTVHVQQCRFTYRRDPEPWEPSLEAGAEARCCGHSISRVRSEETDVGCCS
jgi:hypothetical protein